MELFRRAVNTSQRKEANGFCPIVRNGIWRLLLVRDRSAALRTRSESFPLKSADLLWEEGKRIVESPKTGLRAMPLFPRVRKVLGEAFELAEPEAFALSPKNTVGRP